MDEIFISLEDAKESITDVAKTIIKDKENNTYFLSVYSAEFSKKHVWKTDQHEVIGEFKRFDGLGVIQVESDKK